MKNFAQQIPHNDYTCEWMRPVREAAIQAIGTPVPSFDEEKFLLFGKTGSRVEYEWDYFAIRRQFNLFVAMALWEEDLVWIRETERILEALLELPTWALPAHCALDDKKSWPEKLDLFACETAQAISETMVLLGDRLSPALKEKLRQALVVRTVEPYLKSRRKWGKCNWSAVCAGSLIQVFISQFPDQLEQALPTLLDALEDFLESYRSDGCCLEGPLYWEYGFGYFVYTAERLRSFTEGKIDLFANEKVRKIAKFGFDMFLGGADVIPFADAPHSLKVHIGLMHFLGKEYHLGGFPHECTCMFDEDCRYRFAPMIRDLYWQDPQMDTTREIPEENSDYPEAGWFIRRSSGGTLVCKGGHNGEPHNHNDVGSFVLYDDGFILDDPGWPEYDKGYCSERRYEYICASSAGHSVPMINGCTQSEGADHRAEVLCRTPKEICMDLSKAYDCSGLRFLRTYRIAEDGMTMTDSFHGAQTVTERFVTRQLPVIEEKEVRIGAWQISVDVPATIHCSSASFSPRFSGLDYRNAGKEPMETIYLVDFELTKPDGTVQFQMKRRAQA